MGRKRGTTEAEATEEGARERSVTVTYGAFSCTLKGYKHPEDIVKALSEHFKTLAEQAPHFALPPPQVDVALLQQIAAQELRRQMDEGTIDIETVAELAGTPMREVDARAQAAEDAEIAPPPEGSGRPAADPDETPAERSARRRAATIASLRAAVAAATAAAQADRRQGAAAPPDAPVDTPVDAPRDAAPDAAQAAPAKPAADLPPDARPAEAAGEVPDAAPASPPPPPEAAPRATAAPRQTASRLPVLRLVPDLRLDAPAEAAAPAAAANAAPAPDLGFEAYAARAGAQRLAERIEAAAAYLTVIEGRSRFEAAAVVGLVARHPPPDEPADALARADAFAQLVRSGRLRRIEGNRYALTAPELGRATP